MKQTPMITTVVVLFLLTVAVGCGPRSEESAATIEAAPVAQAQPEPGMSIGSPAFEQGHPIPIRFTADGDDLSPPLVISDPPQGTVSMALIMDDPDAPGGTWTHWVVWNIPPDVSEIAEGTLPAGAVEGLNSWGNTGYGGPSPPSGAHRYFFRLYALGTVLEAAELDAAALEAAMRGQELAHAELMGTYSRE